MKTLMFVIVCSTFLAPTASAGTRIKDTQATDIEAIKKTLSSFESAWSQGNAQGLAAVFTEQASLINPRGQSAKGKSEIEKLFTEEHATFAKGTTFTFSDPQITFLAPGMAWLETDGTLSMKNPSGKAPPAQKFHVVLLLIKKGNSWLWEAARPHTYMQAPAAKPAAKK
jgi:uncharacterized protein (TIGR02246 family)